MREAGASDKEIRQVINDSLSVRENAKEIMASHGLQHLGIVSGGKQNVCGEQTTRIKELVSIAAAFSVNCTTSLEKHINLSRSVGITKDEVNSVLDSALFIKGEAAHYVGQITKLKQEKDQLQELLDKLQKTQAQLVQSEKMAALGKLVAGLVHEINTPIGAINSNADVIIRASNNIAETLQKKKTIEPIENDNRFQNSIRILQNNAETTQAASKRISEIITSLKSFIRLDEAVWQETNLQEAMESILLLMEHEFKGKITVVKKYSHIPLITCNAAEINQVFMNLLRNAKAAIRSKGTVKIRTFTKDENLFVEISDNGVGIKPERLKNLFEPNFTTTEPRVKAGLGLFISNNIIRKHNGEIKVKSKLGEGSTFSVVLPINLKKQQVLETKSADSQATRCEKLN